MVKVWRPWIFAWAFSLLFPLSSYAVCGDTILERLSGEECDDGGVVDGDGCSAACLLELCGDGAPDVGEECDDGNNITGDGCSSRCLDEPSGADNYVAYTIKTPGRDQNRQDILSPTLLDFNNRLPRNWFITVNDQAITDGADDPRTMVVKRARNLLLPATLYPLAGPSTPALHYIRYMAKRLRDEPEHVERQWLLLNNMGSVSVITTGENALLLPSAMDLATAPAAVGAATHYICYLTKNNLLAGATDQNPNGVFDKNLQRYSLDELDDCGIGNPAPTSQVPTFPGTPVEGNCLSDLRIGSTPVRELCHPINMTNPGTGTGASVIVDSNAAPGAPSLLCYSADRSPTFLDATTASLGGGTLLLPKIVPRQPEHYKRDVRRGTGIYVLPESGFVAPTQVTSRSEKMVCLPSRVLAESPV